MKKLVYGKGYNDGSRPAKVAGVHLKEYAVWQKMLQRCFNEKGHIRQPTYKGCTVSDNFLNYSYFYDWCQKQIGFGKQGWQLDKDILGSSNKIYGENTCVFVPREINNFFTDRLNHRGGLPVGVSLHKPNGQYLSSCNLKGKKKHLGLYATPQEAFVVYKTFKEDLCKQLALKWKNEIDERLFNAMMKWEVNEGI